MADFPKPEDSTLWRWLQRAVGLGLACQEGAGRRNDPFRYWLLGREAEWANDRVYQLFQQTENARRLAAKQMGPFA